MVSEDIPRDSPVRLNLEAADHMVRGLGGPKLEQPLALVMVRHQAVARAPQYLLPERQPEMVLKIHIDRLQLVEKRGVIWIGVVVIDAQLKIGVGGECVPPSPEHVATVSSNHQPSLRSRPAQHGDRGFYLSHVRAIEIPLNR